MEPVDGYATESVTQDQCDVRYTIPTYYVLHVSLP